MSTRTMKFLFWFVAIALIMACTSSLGTPFPTADPNQINLFIQQTAHAASSQTAAARPASSSTPTLTPTPRNTDTPSPTFTSTVIFILASPTRPATLTPISSGGGGSGGGGSSGGGTSSDNFACQVISVTPANGTTFNPRDDFDAVWRVKNIGVRGWDRNSVDFIYSSGAEIHKVSGYDLSRDADPGQTIDLGVDMEAPRNPGNYTTTWTLRVGDRTFCNMSLTINVR